MKNPCPNLKTNDNKTSVKRIKADAEIHIMGGSPLAGCPGTVKGIGSVSITTACPRGPVRVNTRRAFAADFPQAAWGKDAIQYNGLPTPVMTYSKRQQVWIVTDLSLRHSMEDHFPIFYGGTAHNSLKVLACVCHFTESWSVVVQRFLVETVSTLVPDYI